jgi:FkbM family methyltransferase
MLHRIRGLLNYRKVFRSAGDIRAFRHVAYGGGDQPVDVRVREAGDAALRIRPRTSDAAVLWDTFHEKFHLPPVPLPARATILDLGANVGYTAAHFAHLYPEATIVAVELDRANYDAAALNLRSMPGCRVINAAVWSVDGTVAYDRTEQEWGYHVTESGAAKGAASATAVTISTLMAQNGISTVDYMKMDIEGAEWPVLSGGADWLPRIRSMKVELHPKFNADATFDNCARVLSAQGFTCRKDDRHWDTLVALRN